MYDNHVTGQLIREIRIEKGITQEVLSGLAAVSRSHLAMIENGSIDAKIDTLWRISEALGIRFSELMKRVEEAQIHNK
ncbi:MAG: helix-turn-helix transcriptional regulator [Clostridia bacterium]|nr:helix-turn-helix transcriptional regulator [Clostridia bacterium]